MKTYIITLSAGIALTAISSCSTARKSTAEIRSESHVTMDSILSSKTNRVTEAITVNEGEEDTRWGSITTITIYDTAAPIDTATGRHPVKAEYMRRDSIAHISARSERDSTRDATESEVRGESHVQITDSTYCMSQQEAQTTDNSSGFMTRLMWIAIAIAAILTLSLMPKKRK